MRLDRTIAWGLLVVALLGNAAGVFFELYAEIWWYDKALHCFFSFAVTLVLALYAYGVVLTGRHHHKVLLVLTIAGLGLALGTLWEFVEWAYGLGG
jgi:TctA family transporter